MKKTSSEEGQRVGQESPADVAEDCDDDGAFPAKNDFRVLVATAATGALLGWSVARSLDLDLDLAGAVAGKSGTCCVLMGFR